MMQPTAPSLKSDDMAPPAPSPGSEGIVTATLAPGSSGTNGSSLDLDRLLEALQSMRRGEFSVRLPGNETGLAGKIADTFNDIVSANQRLGDTLGDVGE